MTLCSLTIDFVVCVCRSSTLTEFTTYKSRQFHSPVTTDCRATLIPWLAVLKNVNCAAYGYHAGIMSPQYIHNKKFTFVVLSLDIGLQCLTDGLIRHTLKWQWNHVKICKNWLPLKLYIAKQNVQAWDQTTKIFFLNYSTVIIYERNRLSLKQHWEDVYVGKYWNWSAFPNKPCLISQWKSCRRVFRCWN